jgi:hypothetical protein
MAGYEWFYEHTVTFSIAHNISSAEEKVDILKSKRSMYEDLSVLSIVSVLSAVGRTILEIEWLRSTSTRPISSGHSSAKTTKTIM